MRFADTYLRPDGTRFTVDALRSMQSQLQHKPVTDDQGQEIGVIMSTTLNVSPDGQNATLDADVKAITPEQRANFYAMMSRQERCSVSARPASETGEEPTP